MFGLEIRVQHLPLEFGLAVLDDHVFFENLELFPDVELPQLVLVQLVDPLIWPLESHGCDPVHRLLFEQVRVMSHLFHGVHGHGDPIVRRARSASHVSTILSGKPESMALSIVNSEVCAISSRTSCKHWQGRLRT